MRLPSSLFIRIIFWSLVNLGVIAFVMVAMFRVELRMDAESPFYGHSVQRLQELASTIETEIADNHWDRWDEVIEKHASSNRVDIFLFTNVGEQLAGPEVTLPVDVLTVLRTKPGGGPRDLRSPENTAVGFRGHSYRLFRTKTTEPSRYWVGVRIPVHDLPGIPPRRGSLLLRSKSLAAGGLFFDVVPWVKIGVCLVLMSVVLWYPLIRSITRPIEKLTVATEAIADGKFDQEVDINDTSELGRLGEAVNHMAGRLDHFITGQKRFMGDIAHELCSPVARLRMALEILDLKAGPELKGRVKDLEEEVVEMTELVNELLSFSKAGVAGTSVDLIPVPAVETARKAVDRETREGGRVFVEGDESIQLLGTAEFVDRAVGNLIRNALRYAGKDHSIRIIVQALNGDVYLRVKDQGPGIPDDVVDHIFDPFFRPEESRNRETGGVGLGLAIVRSCVHACGGSVRCRNRTDKGLEVTMKFKRVQENQGETGTLF